MTTTTRRLLAGAAALALSAGLLACGGSGSDTATPIEEPADSPLTIPGLDHHGGGTVGLGGGAASLEASCREYVEVSRAMAGLADGDPVAVINGFAQHAPIDVRAHAMVVAQGFAAAGSDPGALAGEDFRSSMAQLGDFYFDHCELADQVQVGGVDFAFAGLPGRVDAGVVGFELSNMTSTGEPHELVLLRRPAGDARSVAELAHLPVEQLMADHELVAVAFAETSDDTMAVLVDLQPGSYLAICTIPTAGDATAPHAHHGMVAALEVA